MLVFSMTRPLRIEYPFAYYHVMNRGLSSQDIFQSDSDREMFIKLLGNLHEMWGIRVIAYCLMDNHYHLFIQTPEGNLSRVMRHLDGVYTQRFNRTYHRDGPLFRGRYKAIVVDGDEYLLAVARYIHHNPVEAGLIQRQERYPWSSMKEYVRFMEGGKVPEWLDVVQLLEAFPRQGRKEAFISFMRSKIGDEERGFYERKNISPVLGGLEFIEGIKKRIKKGKGSYEEIPEAKAYLKISAEDCVQAIRRMYQISREELIKAVRGIRNEARNMGMLVCRRVGGMKLEEIARLFGVEKYTTVNSAIRRMSKEIEAGGEAKERYKKIRKLLVESQNQI